MQGKGNCFWESEEQSHERKDFKVSDFKKKIQRKKNSKKVEEQSHERKDFIERGNLRYVQNGRIDRAVVR